MNNKRPDLSRGKRNNSMLANLLKKWEMDYNGFADFLGVHRQALWRYRRGEREFRLNMEQIQKLERLLKKVKMDFSALPLDWYLDKIEDEENQWEEVKTKS